MSAFSGPEISSNGLVFYYDMNNNQKSWKGAPTTNLMNNPFLLNGTGMSNLFLGYEATSSIVTAPNEDCRRISEYWYKFEKNNASNGRVWFLNLSGLSTNVDYVYSCYLFTNDANCNSFTLGSDNGAISNTLENISTWSTSDVGTVKRIAARFRSYTGGTSQGLRIFASAPIGTIFYVSAIQTELSSIVTPVVDGTRSTTQSILDLTNRNTVTIQNLSYNSDNTFSFDGVDDFCAVSELGQLTTFTCEVWCRPTSYPNNNACVISSVYPGTNSTVNFKIGYEGATGLTGGFYDGTWRLSPSVGTFLNIWQQIVFTYDGAKLTIYSNGLNGGSTAYVGTPNSGGSGFRIGRRWDIGDYYAGSIGIAKVYNRALTNEEIAQNFQAVRGRFGI